MILWFVTSIKPTFQGQVLLLLLSTSLVQINLFAKPPPKKSLLGL